VAPNAAASGKITRHRLNRGGDYQSNLALYLLAVGRMRRDSSVGSGHTKPKINTCLKRYIAPGAGLTGSARRLPSAIVLTANVWPIGSLPDGIMGAS